MELKQSVERTPYICSAVVSFEYFLLRVCDSQNYSSDVMTIGT
jgi:hypothetical protein